jgi:hypothetical protein
MTKLMAELQDPAPKVLKKKKNCIPMLLEFSIHANIPQSIIAN